LPLPGPLIRIPEESPLEEAPPTQEAISGEAPAPQVPASPSQGSSSSSQPALPQSVSEPDSPARKRQLSNTSQDTAMREATPHKEMDHDQSAGRGQWRHQLGIL
jgi:hypothetical protein